MIIRLPHVLAAMAIALLLNTGLVLLLARTTPAPRSVPHVDVPIIPFVAEAAPPPPMEPTDDLAAPPAPAVRPAPPASSPSPTSLRLPPQALLRSSGLQPSRLHQLGSGPPRSAGPQEEVREASEVEEPPRALSTRPPRYPADAEAQGVEGSVTIRLRIGVDGRVGEAAVLRATAPGTFDRAALAAVRSWRFSPARDGGRPVEVWAQKTLRFDLR